jgi:hypothetical protein
MNRGSRGKKKADSIDNSFSRDVGAHVQTRKEKLYPYILITYSLKGLPPKNKMALQRGLFGYKTEKRYGKKRYFNVSRGLVGNDGRRIGRTAFLLRLPEADRVRALFRKCECGFKGITIWVEGDR